jgi:DNA helicase HerA-like ATPase
MSQRTDFGVLYGQRTTDEDSLLIYSSYEDAKASPKRGDFIVLTPRNEDGIKFLARVETEIYDEDPIFRSQDKTLVAVHYARIAERELSERDKQKMFSYTYKVQMLGTFTDKGTSFTFTTAVRKLPIVSYHARHLNPNEIKNIINKQDEGGVPIGHLCIGEEIHADKGEICFDLGRLRSRRTMVFAQSGFGKTNLMKVLLYHAIGNTGFGKLVFDLNGEYVLDSEATVGLGGIAEQKIRDNLIVYTDKKLPEGHEKRFTYAGKVKLNTHVHMTVGDILNFGAGFSEVMKSFLLYLDDEGVNDFVSNIDKYVASPSLLYQKYPDFWGKSQNGDGDKEDKKEDKSARKTIAAIRKRISHLIDEGSIHDTNSKLIENVFLYLKQGKTVVIDLSLKDSMDASIISTVLVRKLFDHNKEKFTSDESSDVIETVIIVEEAQNVLSSELVRTNANPFVRCAKEGRKFKLGLVAITQRPSAISDEIRTQAENFFAFHMGNSDDIKALVKSNIHYDGVISNFIQRETIKGNLYMVTSDRAFVVPIRVHEFEKLVHKQKPLRQ